MLTFAIASRDQEKKLKVCIDSICDQIDGREGFKVVVCDNASTDGTRELLEEYAARYKFIKYRILSKVRVGTSWVECANMSETDWTWTLCDNDILLPGALDKIVAVLKTFPELQYVHATQSLRSNSTRKVFKAKTFLDLCITYGWIDTCGFISSNICKTSLLVKAYSSYLHYNDNIKTIFPEAACLLETIHDHPAAIFDENLVDRQAGWERQESSRRWQVIDPTTRYIYIIDALIEILNRVPHLKKTFPSSFFRYYSSNLWDRYLTDLTHEFNEKRIATNQYRSVPEFTWKKILSLADLVSDEEVKKRILLSIASHRELTEGLVRLEAKLNQSLNICESEVYGDKNINILPSPSKNILETSAY